MIVRDGLVIRGIERKDLQKIMEWNTEEGRGEFLDLNFKSMETLNVRIAADGFLSDEVKLLIIEVKGEPVGLVYAHFLRPGLVNLGLGLCAKEARFHGLGVQVGQLMVEYLFNNFPLARIEAETDVENVPAQKVLERIGFLREGRLRNFRFHHGKYRDFYMYSITPEEWK